MTEIYLVRHGQASFTSDNYDQLSDLGRRQSEFLGQYFAERHLSFEQLFTGSQQRHHQTADAILRDRLPPAHHIHPGLNEYDFSALYRAYMDQHPAEEEQTRDGDRRIFHRRLKKALALWAEDRLRGELPESWAAFGDRVSAAFSQIRDGVRAPCLVVSSGGAISMLIGQILALAPRRIIDLNLQIRNASFSHIRLGRDAAHLSSFNNIPHLDRIDRLDAITYS